MAKDKDKGKEKGNKPKFSIKDKKKKKMEKLREESLRICNGHGAAQRPPAGRSMRPRERRSIHQDRAPALEVFVFQDSPGYFQ